MGEQKGTIQKTVEHCIWDYERFEDNPKLRPEDLIGITRAEGEAFAAIERELLARAETAEALAEHRLKLNNDQNKTIGAMHLERAELEAQRDELREEVKALQARCRDAMIEHYECVLLEHSYPVGVPNAERMNAIEQHNHVNEGGYLYHSCMRDQEEAIAILVEQGVYELHENGSWYRRIRPEAALAARDRGGEG